MDRNDRTHVLSLLCQCFSLEELRTLCFELGEDHEKIHGEGKEGWAFEFVLYLQRRDRTLDLLKLCKQKRPHVLWPSIPGDAPGVRPDAGQANPFSLAMFVLEDFMRVPEVHDVVKTFWHRFEAARAQIAMVDGYKRLHSLLHRVQFECYEPIYRHAHDFPDDEIIRDIIERHEGHLRDIIDESGNAAELGSFAAADTAWITDLVAADEAWRAALQESKSDQLQVAIAILHRVLSRYPMRINMRLNAVVGTLPLQVLVETMTDVRHRLSRHGLDREKVSQFEAGEDWLKGLSRNLNASVDTHDKWQDVDRELRRIEDAREQLMTELEKSWPNLKAMTEPLHIGITHSWATFFRSASDDLDRAIGGHDLAHIRNCFGKYCSEARRCFDRVDTDLKRLCKNLPEIAKSLDSVLRRG